MKFELKNIKYAAFASQETPCFQATVYIDGKRAFGVSNEGHGGPDDFFPADKKTALNEVWARVKQIDEELKKETLIFDDFTIQNSIEIVIGNLLDDYLTQKEMKKALKKICYLGKDQAVFTVNLPPSEENIGKVKKQKWWNDSYTVLNNLPYEEIKNYF